MAEGFVQIGCCVPHIRVGDWQENCRRVKELLEEAESAGCTLAVFPESVFTGVTCGDLFWFQAMQKGVEEAFEEVLQLTKTLSLTVVLGMAVSFEGNLYNCGVVLSRGRILGAVPKDYAKGNRQFSGGQGEEYINLLGQTVPFGGDLLFASEVLGDFTFALTFNTPFTLPSGAALIVDMDSSYGFCGKENLSASRSRELNCGYINVTSGAGESTTDQVYTGHSTIYELGELLGQNPDFSCGLWAVQMDFSGIMAVKRAVGNTKGFEMPARRIYFGHPVKPMTLTRQFSKNPYISGEKSLEELCAYGIRLQEEGLAARLLHSGCKEAVIAVSGGLDSTLALLVTAGAFERLGWPKDKIKAITMPCFGTTSRTKNNAEALSLALGVQFSEIPIKEAVEVHFRDIGQPEGLHDVTYENAQARERTQILMDLANQVNGLVIGTGDMSELALGWATYNGDHMSMYGVNAGVPKTMVRLFTQHAAKNASKELREVLLDILDTPVSPELLPPVEGEIQQRTEDLVGPYELHDFFLYHLMTRHASPEKLLKMAVGTFIDSYSQETVKKWLAVFLKRFYTQQFKRSCMPDGPQIFCFSLSPRGGLTMPSDTGIAGLTLLDK